MLAMLLGLAFAALTETIQLFVPARAADVLDWAIDAIGVGFGAAFRNKQFKGLS
jgi:VanZ family protein